MNCDEIKELLSIYIDNECSEREKEEINEHLKNCTSCMKEYKSINTLINKINEIDELEIPKGLHDDVMHKISVMSSKKNTILSKIRRSYSVVAAAIIICVIFGYIGTGMLMKLSVKDSALEYTATTDTASSEKAPMMMTNEVNENTSNETKEDLRGTLETPYVNSADNAETIDINKDEAFSIEYDNEYGNCITLTDNEIGADDLKQTNSQDPEEWESPQINENYSTSEALSDTNILYTTSIDENTDTATDKSNMETTVNDSISEKSKVDNSKSDITNIDNQGEEGINGTTIIVVILAALIFLVPGTLLTLTRRKRPK